MLTACTFLKAMPGVAAGSSSSSTGRKGACGVVPNTIDTRQLQALLLRQRISNMFRRYVPTKLHRLEIALQRYQGKEDVLLRALVAKFGPEPPFNVEQQQLRDTLEQASSSVAYATEQLHHRSAGGDAIYPLTPSAATGRRDRSAFGSSTNATMSNRADTSSSLGGDGPPEDPVRCRTTSPPSVDQFPAAVALVAHHHQLRSRLFEMYTAKRSLIRMQEEKDREALARLVAFEFRHLMSALSRRQAESLLLAQKEKAAQMEAQLALRKQEETRLQWIQSQSSALLQKAVTRREETHGEERSERRRLTKAFSDELVKLFRTERRLARLREAAEEEARRLQQQFGETVPISELSHRQRLEDALSNIDRDRRDNHHSSLPSMSKRSSCGESTQDVAEPDEFNLFRDLGTTVSFSVGGERHVVDGRKGGAGEKPKGGVGGGVGVALTSGRLQLPQIEQHRPRAKHKHH